MNTHIDDADVCYYGCGALWNITAANTVNQKQACESGCVNAIYKIHQKYQNFSKDIATSCCAALGTLLSNQEIYTQYYAQQIIEMINESAKNYNDSEDINLFAKSLQRQEDERVKDCVTRGVCTKTAFPKCSDECKCDEGLFCSKCCVQQKCYRCLDCAKQEIKLYCEVCWKKHHKDHNCVEFFYPMRCATK